MPYPWMSAAASAAGFRRDGGWGRRSGQVYRGGAGYYTRGEGCVALVESINRYNGVTQIIHWVSALLILCMIPLGLVMHNLSEGTAKDVMYNTHVSVGMVVLLVTAVRLGWLAFHRWPAPLPMLSTWRRRVFTGVHVVLYGVLVVVLLSGVMMVVASDMSPIPGTIQPEAIKDVPPRMVHDLLTKVLIVALVIHIVGVVDYQVRKGDTLSRMGILLFSRSG